VSPAQGGTTTVEFAVAGGLALMVLFGCIEMGRMLFVWNTVAESTRVAARIAAVCPPNDPAIAQAALIASADGTRSRILFGLTPAHVNLSYLDEDGGTTGEFAEIRYVRVGISGYEHQLLIPFVARTVTVPPFQTTVPAESLGLVPETGERVCLMG
jgi:hypothetical protein